MIRVRNKPIIGVFIFVLAVVSAVAQDTPVTSKIIAMNKRAVVPLLAVPANTTMLPPEPAIEGSGFFINERGDFVTAAHVLDGIKNELKTTEDSQPVIHLPIGGWTLDQPMHNFQWFKFKDCIRSTNYDVVVCHPKTNPFQQEKLKHHLAFVTFGPSIGKPEGTPIAITGFPLSMIRPVTAMGIIASFFDQGQKLIINGASWPGGSGSPVFIGDGSVIGLLSAGGVGQSTGLSFVLPSENIIEFLKSAQVPFTQREQSKPSKQRRRR